MTHTALAGTAKAPIAYYPEIRTLADAPRVHGRDRPNHRVFHFEGRDTTFAEFDRHTAQVANGLLSLGLGKGARVVYLGKNSDRYFELLYGASRAGTVLAPVNWRLAEPEVVYIVNDTEAEIIFVDSACAAMVERILAKLPRVRAVVAMEAGTKWETFEAWRDRWATIDPKIPVERNDVALQLYTSGTTGRPKGVQLTQKSFSAFNEHAGENPGAFGPEMDWNEWCSEDVSLVAMPVFHISGSGWGIVGVYSGAFTVVLREFDNAAVIDAVRKFRVSKTVLVPTTIQMMLDFPGRQPGDFASMTDFLYGASPIPLDLLERAVKAFKCGFVQLYGMTETCGAVTYLPREDHYVGNPRMRSAGKTIPGAEIRIMDPESNEIYPPGKTGEICIKAPGTMVGYWKQDDETARVIQADGWVRSGDAGYMDEAGYVFIQDRVKDMIVSGGENIYPAEVENAMRLHPDVSEVAVIAVPDEKWGEAVKAVVVLTPDAKADAKALLDFTRTQVAGYKVPKSIDFIDALPRSATGKVLKKDLRAPYWSGKDRQVN